MWPTMQLFRCYWLSDPFFVLFFCACRLAVPVYRNRVDISVLSFIAFSASSLCGMAPQETLVISRPLDGIRCQRQSIMLHRMTRANATRKQFTVFTSTLASTSSSIDIAAWPKPAQALATWRSCTKLFAHGTVQEIVHAFLEWGALTIFSLRV